MELADFRDSLLKGALPDGLGSLLRALWHDAKGDWSRAHDIVQDEDGRDAAWVHAYLHRLEGDAGNAAYWYRQAKKPVATGAPEPEWDAIVGALLDRGD